MTRKLLLTLIAPALLAACGTPAAGSAPSTAPAATVSATPSTTPTPTPTATPTPTPAAPPVTPTVFVASNMALGTVLVNAQGRTIYYFVPERGGRVVCTGQCTNAWPPVFVSSMAPTAGTALPGQLGVIARAGSEQITYNHWPLYTFAGDGGPDQTNGQGVFGFGGKWFVATPRLQP